MLNALTPRWNRFWFHPMDPRGLALVRMVTALTGLWTVWEMRDTLGYVNYPGGVPPEASAIWVGRTLMRLPAGWELLSAPPVPGILLATLGLGLLSLGLGYRPVLAAGVSWFLLSWFQTRNPLILNGGDDMLRILLFYLAVGHLVVPAGARAWSVGPGTPGEGRLRWTGGHGAQPLPESWPVRLIQLQLVTLYLTSGLWKASGAEWWDGTALWLAVATPGTGRMAIPHAPELQWLFLLLGIATVAWQLLFPALVWLPATRWIILVMGVVFHVTTGVTMQLGPFPAVVLAAYPAFLFHRSRGWTLEGGRGISTVPEAPERDHPETPTHSQPPETTDG